MSLSVIIPVYNEEECISNCIDETQQVLSDIEHEIILVNDGSSDRTDTIIRQGIQNNDNVIYLSYSTNRGYSHAIRKGLDKATKKYVSIIDADLQYHPQELLRMYHYATERNISFVIGEPEIKYYSYLRSIISHVYNTFVSLLFNISIDDANSLKVMERKYMENINLDRDYECINLEFLLGFHLQGIPINKIPIHVQERMAGRSKCSIGLIYRTIIGNLVLKTSMNKLIKKGSSKDFVD